MDKGFVACKGIVSPVVPIGFSSGMQDERFTCMGGFIITLGRSLGVDEGLVACNGTVGPGVSRVLEDGFSCMGVWGGVGFACKGV